MVANNSLEQTRDSRGLASNRFIVGVLGGLLSLKSLGRHYYTRTGKAYAAIEREERSSECVGDDNQKREPVTTLTPN